MATVKGGEKLEAALAEMAKKVSNPGTLSVGFQDGSSGPDGVLNSMKAAINNYGAPGAGIPPRPFFSNMVKDKSGGWAGDIVKLLKYHGMDATATLKDMGEKIQGQLVDSIFNGSWAPNAPSTLKRKAGKQPLVDTGAMAGSVTWVIK